MFISDLKLTEFPLLNTYYLLLSVKPEHQNVGSADGRARGLEHQSVILLFRVVTANFFGAADQWFLTATHSSYLWVHTSGVLSRIQGFWTVFENFSRMFSQISRTLLHWFVVLGFFLWFFVLFLASFNQSRLYFFELQLFEVFGAPEHTSDQTVQAILYSQGEYPE